MNGEASGGASKCLPADAERREHDALTHGVYEAREGRSLSIGKRGALWL